MKTIFLLLALNLFGILCVGQTSDTLCLTSKEYNDLLVASNCTELYKADSILLWDKSQHIALLNDKVSDKDVYIEVVDGQLKRSKRQVFKWKFGMFTAILLGITSNIYLIFK